jgi:predicted metal-binding protein
VISVLPEPGLSLLSQPDKGKIAAASTANEQEMATREDEVRALGKSIGELALQADLERYCRIAREMGAADVVVLPAQAVNVDERVRLKCVIPRCLRAGETPNCPPHAPELEVVRRAIARYSWAVLFKCEVTPMQDYAPQKTGTKEEMRRTLVFHQKTAEIVYELERHAYKDGYYLALGLSGGSCKDYLCQGLTCQFIDSGRCRFPLRSRPAIEALGIDVIDLVNKAGWSAYALLGDVKTIPCAISVGMILVS